MKDLTPGCFACFQPNPAVGPAPSTPAGCRAHPQPRNINPSWKQPQECSGEMFQQFQTPQGWFGVDSIAAGPWCSVGISVKPFPFSLCQENPWDISPVVAPPSPGQEQLWPSLPWLVFTKPPARMRLKRYFSLFSSLPDRPGWLTRQQLEPTPYFGALLSAGDDTAHLHPSPLKQM